MTEPDLEKHARKRLDEAVAWHLRVNSPDADAGTFAAFTAWLEADPANRLAFDQVEQFDKSLDGLPLADLSQQADTDFVGFGRSRSSRPSYALQRVITGITAIAAALIIFFLLKPPAVQPIAYSTEIGQKRTVTLADGSQIEMNTATALSVASQADGRHVVLDHGEAIFHVVRNVTQPFTVAVGDREIRDIGTTFDVLREAGAIAVVVAEGSVKVTPRWSTANAAGISLTRGDRLVHDEVTGATSVGHVDPDQVLSWRRGYLVYHNAPLSKVVLDLNRYFPVPIVLEDKMVAAQRFSGVLQIDNEDAVVKRISEFLPVISNRRVDGKIGLREIHPKQ